MSELIERLTHKALHHHFFEPVPQTLPIDSIAFFSGLNLLNEVLKERQFYMQSFSGTLQALPKQSKVFFKPLYQSESDDTFFYVYVAKLILVYRVDTIGAASYFFSGFGSHNQLLYPKKLLKDKAVSLIIPFDLISSVKKDLMPINPTQALFENALHPSFCHKLSPSPAASIAINHDLDNQMGFVVHPKMLNNFLDVEDKQVAESMKYDTKIALELLRDRYDVFVNTKALRDLVDIDDKVGRLDGKACIEIQYP